jgi:hypothetical protein
MKKFTCSLVLLALLGLGMVPSAANAQGKIVAYFDAAGTQRNADSPGANQLQTMYIYGEDFPAAFVAGVQYKIDYGANLTFVADQGIGGAFIGNSATGLSIGFGLNPQPGAKFLIQTAFCIWNADCAAGVNVQGPTSEAHPLFPDPGPIAVRFPDQSVLQGEGTRSMTCPMVELDIHPLFCPNPFKANVWNWVGNAKPWKGGLLAVAVLGSSSLNVNDLDNSTILLEGVAPLPWPQTSWFDVGTADGDNACVCDFPMHADDDDDSDESFNHLIGLQRDGYKDLLLFFHNVDIAEAIGPEAPEKGTVVTLTMSGAYDDGLPFEASDCVTIKGGSSHHHTKGHRGGGSSLGFPSPNPFNPVTRISYNVESTQHVNISIYNVAGQLVENLVDETKAPGDYVVEWNAGALPSGVYFYRMKSGSETIVRRATLLK